MPIQRSFKICFRSRDVRSWASGSVDVVVACIVSSHVETNWQQFLSS
jgi:hypothetical protein